MKTISWLCYFFLLGLSPSLMADVYDAFNEAKENSNALYAFLKEMPKGGELHYHLAGGAYPEYMLKLAMQHPYCLDLKTFTIFEKTPCLDVSTEKLAKYPMYYDKTIQAWSMKDFFAGSETPHDHFFETFYKFYPIVASQPILLLADVMKRAANQHELYMEIMLIPGERPNSPLKLTSSKPDALMEAKRTLFQDPLFRKTIQNNIDKTNALLPQVHEYLSCKKHPEKKVCHLSIAFQYHVLREAPLASVFQEALLAFEVASKSRNLVAVNLVQPEDGMIALKDYHQHMQIFDFLHKLYPNIPIALHAGELSPKAVTPHDLSFHIQEAISIGHAKRIGHGVDIGYEKNAVGLLKKMALEKIAVEINLTSNETILGVYRKNHPLQWYLNYHIPVVLSTDDEGILRTDLTREYVKAVLEYGIDYDTLKTINRNTLTYSFLKGASLWDNPEKGIPIPACHDLTSPSCKKFLKTSEKATLQYQLEQALLKFEKQHQ